MSDNIIPARREFLRSVGIGSVLAVMKTNTFGTENATGQEPDKWWPQYGYDAGNTGYNPSAEVPVDKIRTEWTFNTDLEEDMHIPSVSNGRVYVSAGRDRLYAIDSNTGDKLWSIEAARVYSPSIVDGVVYLGTPNGVLAVEEETGNRLWEFEAEDIGTTNAAVGLSVENNRIYLGVHNGVVYSLDRGSGEELWNFDIVEELNLASRVEARRSVSGPPAISNNQLFVCYDFNLSGDENSNYVVALDTETGELLWEREHERVKGVPAAIGSSVYYTSFSSRKLYAVDGETGETIWSVDLDTPARGSPAITGESVYITPSDDQIYSIDRGTGEIQWQHEMSHQLLAADPIVGSEVVYGVTANRIFAFDSEDGNQLWTFEQGASHPHGAAAIANGHLYFGSDDGTVYALTGETTQSGQDDSVSAHFFSEDKSEINNSVIAIASGLITMLGYIMYNRYLQE